MAPATSARDTFSGSSAVLVEELAFDGFKTIPGNCGESTIRILCGGMSIPLSFVVFTDLGLFEVVRTVSIGLLCGTLGVFHICCAALAISSGVVAVTIIAFPLRSTIRTGHGHPQRQNRYSFTTLLGIRGGSSGIGKPNALHSF